MRWNKHKAVNLMEISKHIQELEGNLLEADVRSSEFELNKLLSEDFVEFGSSGKSWTKNEIIISLLNEVNDNDYSLSTDDFTVKKLADAVMLATYKCRRLNFEGEIVKTTLRSSIWRLVDCEWKLYFHQGTIVPE